jgi:hypothetical protein
MIVLNRCLLASCVASAVTSLATVLVAADDFSIEIVPAARNFRSQAANPAAIWIAPGPSADESASPTAGPPLLIIPAQPLTPVAPEAPTERVESQPSVPATVPKTEQARHSASEQALTEWERTVEKQRVLALSTGTDSEDSASPTSENNVAPAEAEAEHAHSTERDPGSLARLYSEIYASIPFNRSDYDRNPSYRHDATMELLLGQLRPTVVAPPAQNCGCSQCRRDRSDDVYNPPYFYRRTYRHYLSIPWYRWLRY